MALAQSELQRAAQRQPLRKSQVYSGRQRMAFLCHSHVDKELAEGLQVWLAEQGVDLYIDWKDSTMPETPDRETAQRIQRRIVDSDWFLFLATANSKASRWCSWELGYADGKKNLHQIAIVPTADGRGTYGNEYLQLYRRLDSNSLNQLYLHEAGSSLGTAVRNIRF
ncbi:toll/interleukin-1 receptor domain-containing protein [Ideonella sp. B7]|uniref:toll/interleukin-1 receptor domain-containing protein n=1 Tax=Ideonella benzenivorans TaxID=2831643 RepID=UPI001CEC476D|nr:toll/interleukin-1 receptor domain-containing protein [Ideonella benzenivorans]MCA6218559.1 toll/interleukin-1 receptor domain-containing protein [Ideonella benzenivorans]